MNGLFTSEFVHNEPNCGATSIGAPKIQPRITSDGASGGRLLTVRVRFRLHECDAHDLCHMLRLSNGGEFVTHGAHELVFNDLVMIVQLFGIQAVHPSVLQCGSKLVKQTAGCEIPVVFTVGAYRVGVVTFLGRNRCNWHASAHAAHTILWFGASFSPSDRHVLIYYNTKLSSARGNSLDCVACIT